MPKMQNIKIANIVLKHFNQMLREVCDINASSMDSFSQQEFIDLSARTQDWFIRQNMITWAENVEDEGNG